MSCVLEAWLPDFLGRSCDLLGLEIWNLAFWPKGYSFRMADESGEEGKAEDYSEFISDHIYFVLKKGDTLFRKMKVNFHVEKH